MRIFLVCIMAGVLFIISGCGTVTQPAATGQPVSQEEASEAQQNENSVSVDDTANTARVRGSAENNRNMLQTGKIVSISENEITVELATIQRPEGSAPDGTTPPKAREGTPDERQRPEGSRPEAKQGERKIPEGGLPNGGGRGFGGQMNLTYSGEQKTYALTESVKITKGTGEKSEAIAITDLAKDDVVRLELDESGNLISVQLWNIATNTSSEASATQS